MEHELGRLILQVGGIVVMTIAIGLLVPFVSESEEPRTEDDRPDRVFP